MSTSPQTIAVMGASGRTGGAAARQLLAAGHDVRVLARSAERLASLTALGATALPGAATDAAYLASAFAGADAVYVMMPHDPSRPGYPAEQQHQGEAIVRALRDAAVGRVVALSSVGADAAHGNGIVQALHEQEQRLRALQLAAGIDVLLLRPGVFFENYQASLPTIRAAGTLFDALDPDLAMPMVAAADVGRAVAAAMVSGDWKGLVVRDLRGPRDLSSREVAAVLAQRLQLPQLSYTQLPYDALAQALVEDGMAPDFAALLADLARGLNDGTVRAQQPRSAATITPTSFEEFAGELVEAWGQMS